MAFGGRNVTWQEALKDLDETVRRHAATVMVTRGGEGGIAAPFVVSAGSYQALKVSHGYIVTMGLSRAQLTELRDRCNELLEDSSPRPS